MGHSRSWFSPVTHAVNAVKKAVDQPVATTKGLYDSVKGAALDAKDWAHEHGVTATPKEAFQGIKAMVGDIWRGDTGKLKEDLTHNQSHLQQERDAADAAALQAGLKAEEAAQAKSVDPAVLLSLRRQRLLASYGRDGTILTDPSGGSTSLGSGRGKTQLGL